ncbi:hypothetical protein [Gordonia hongkongensis]|uniref:hypothetical protein n=1 Tax=Gordonia hongkongensis TaxID=1701090 RepID=UPI003EB8DE75
MHEILPSHEVVHLPHPILKKQISHQKRGDPVVLVAGQYKPERDIALLSRIGPRLRAQGYRTKIVGVGWPTVAGWEVLDKFVSEDELDRELSGATVNLVAYKNYFQSGIAVRALERGTLTVGALTPFVLNLYRGSQKYLVDADRNGDVDSQYLSAIERVATLPDRREVRSTFDEYRAYVTDRWQRWLAELGMP